MIFVGDELSSSYSKITVSGVTYDVLAERMQNQLDAIGKNVLVNGDEIDFTSDLKFYLVKGIAQLTLSGESEVIITYNTYTYKIVDNYSEEFNTINEEIFIVSSGTDSSNVYARLNVRGVSLYSVAQYALSLLPDAIEGAAFLPASDKASGATLTWVVDEEFMSEDGRVVKAVSDTDWLDVVCRVGVIADSLGFQSRQYKEITVRLLDARERTEKIFPVSQIVFDSVYSETNTQYEMIDCGYISPLGQITVNETTVYGSGLVGITATLDERASDNLLSSEYLQVLSTGEGADYNILRVVTLPSSAYITIGCKFTLEYLLGFDKDGTAVYGDYTVSREIIIFSARGSDELYDPTLFLQLDFTNNVYINGSGYEFTANAYTEKGMLVDYFVGDEYDDYVAIENCVRSVSADGHFYYNSTTGEYEYFDTLYKKVTTGGVTTYTAITNNEAITTYSNEYYVYNKSDGTYTDISSRENASGENDTDFYTFEARIKVLPSLVPAVETLTAEISAKIYDPQYFGSAEKTYIQSNDVDLEYFMSLIVKGIYHNTPDQIADFNLYEDLKKYYDIDGDGWIQVLEAQTEWNITGDGAGATENALALEPTLAGYSASNTILSTYYNSASPFMYLDFSADSISSLKGIEYFTDLRGLSLSGNSLTDISYLSELSSLRYLDLGSNDITDITALQYLDALEILYLNDNGLTDIAALEYLPTIRVLQLENNPYVDSIEPLENYKNLVYLNIRPGTDPTGLMSVSLETSYFLSLLKGNNSDLTVYRDYNTTNLYTPTSEEIAASILMSNLVVEDEIYTTLDAPGVFDYNGTTYYVKWSTSNTTIDSNYLQFINDSTDTYTTGYVINNPDIDTPLNITVTVIKNVNGTTTSYNLSRWFDVTLLRSLSSAMYIETSVGVFEKAGEVVPDSVLRSLLFDNFNTITTGNCTNNSEYEEASVISQTELNNLISLTDVTGNWASKGITSLKGIECFASALGGELNLSNNYFENADISPLSSLNNLTSLTLAGQAYDFSQLCTYTYNGDYYGASGATETKTGLNGTTLTALNVYGCYETDTDESLAALYQIYLANTKCNIYLENSTTVWNPYTEILARCDGDLPSGFALRGYKEEKSYYDGESVVYNGSNPIGYKFNFYGVLSILFNYKKSSDKISGTRSGRCKALLKNTATGIILETLSGRDDTVYDKTTLQGTDTRGSNNITFDHYVLLRVETNADIYIIDYTDPDDLHANSTQSLVDVFPGQSLRELIMTRLTTVFGGTSAAKKTVASIGAGYYQDSDGNYFITKATLATVTYTARTYYVIDGTYNDDKGRSAIDGMRFLTGLTKIQFRRDVGNIGNGKDLVNLTYLGIVYTGIDFTEITTELPNLTELYLGKKKGNQSDYSISFGEGRNVYCILSKEVDGEPVYGFSNMPNLTELVIYNSNVYDWEGLLGAIQTKNEDADSGNKLKKLLIYSGGEYPNKNSNTTETIGYVTKLYKNYYKAEEIADGLYTEDREYYIGSPTDNTNTTTKFTPDTFVSSGGDKLIPGGTLENEIREFFDEVQDLGVTVTQSGVTVNHTETGNQTLNTGDSIYLPSTSFNAFFGTTYDSTLSLYSDALNYYARDFEITWNVINVENQTTFDSFFSYTDGAITFGTVPSGSIKRIPITFATVSKNSGVTFTVLSRTYDYYLIFEGVLRANSSNEKKFIYPVLVKGTQSYSSTAYYGVYGGSTSSAVSFDASPYAFYTLSSNGSTYYYMSYASFTDISLRLNMALMFMTMAENQYSSSLIPGCVLYSVKSDGTLADSGAYRLRSFLITTVSKVVSGIQYWINESDDVNVSGSTLSPAAIR